MSMANTQDGAAADAGDRSCRLLRRAPADESEAHARRDLEDGERHDREVAEAADPSLFMSLRRAPADESEPHARRDLEDDERHDREVAEAADPSLFMSLRRAPADESERHDHEVADAADPSPFTSLRRAPAKKSEAHDADDPSSHFVPRAPEDVDDGSSHLPPRAPGDLSERHYREDDAGDPSSSPSLRRAPAKKAEAYDRTDTIGPSSFLLPADSNRLRQPQNLQAQVTTSSVHIDPDHIHKLYLGGQLKSLLEYMDSFPGAAVDFHYRTIKELIYISMRGDAPDHLKFEWNVRRAEAARDLAWRTDRRLAILHEALTFTPPGDSDAVPICSAEPCPKQSFHATTSKSSNEGQIFQKIPIGLGFSGQMPDVEGINPLRFYSTHPVWGEHALAVEKDSKVGLFYCNYCDKRMAGNANNAIEHMKKGCKIPLHKLETLLNEVEQYKERVEHLRSAKKESRTRGRKNILENDGMAIVHKSDVANIRELVTELSQTEQYGPLDGVTGVLAMTQSLLTQAQKHLRDGAELIMIADCYKMAARITFDKLDHISQTCIFSAIDKETLVNSCMAALSTNIVSTYKQALADVAVEALIQVTDWERKQVNLGLVHLKAKVGRKLSAQLLHGVFIDKQMSHQHMPKRIEGAKIAFLSFEPSNIDEQLEEMILKCQDIGATLVLCQWNFGEKVSHLLMERKLTVVSGVIDVELKEIANSTGGVIAKRIQDLSLQKLGEAKLVREMKIGKTKGKVLYIESYANPGPVTIFVHAGNNIILEETMRKLDDALFVLRSLIVNDTFVCGGCSAEISCSLAVDAAADASPGYARPFMKSFAHALDAVPLAAVSENSSLLPKDMLTMVKSRHLEEKNEYLGIGCNGCTIEDMKEHHIFSSLTGKKKAILLALEVVKIMLKMHDVT